MARDLGIFVSSVQKELKAERRAVKNFVLQDPLLSRFFAEVFLFEDLPAADRRPGDVYLREVAQHDVFLGIFGYEYGWKNDDGLSPTEREFDRATATNRERLIFVKGDDDSRREPEMAALVRKAASQLTRRRFEDEVALTREVYASLVDYLERRGRLRVTPFDATPCAKATLADIDPRRVRDFVRLAEKEGRLRLRGRPGPKEVLERFNLLSDGRPSNAAVLLFGKDPAGLGLRAEIQCLHFHGVEKRKPIASQQDFGGVLFAQVDQAVEFVLGKIDRRVSDRAAGSRAEVSYEVPRSAVAEAIVNSVAHRDYTSQGFVQVIVFSDRIEVWNPGELPPGLTPERLREPHGPIPRNPLLAEPLYRAHYIEKAGTGTTDMIADCRAAGLPEPSFEQRGPHFVVTLWRDRLTKELVASLALNERQEAVIAALKAQGSLSSAAYQKLTGASRQTASRDLDSLVEKGVVERRGSGRGTRYVLAGRMPQK